MNADPSTNMIVFEIRGHAEPFIANGPTRDDDCVQRAWLALPVKHRRAAGRVTRIYSEWQPSASDVEFIRRTFPSCALTYSFSRPGPDGWEAAFAEASRTMLDAAAESTAANSRQVSEHGELLPVLWSQSSARIESLRFLPHHELVPGQLYVALATVATTPEGRIGMSHLGHGGLGGRTFEDLFAIAAANLARGLRVDGHTDSRRPDKGHLLVLNREELFASSAVALPTFHGQMADALGDGHLLVGLPDPETVLVARADSEWADVVRSAVLESPCPSGELVPSVLAIDPSGIRLLAERQ